MARRPVILETSPANNAKDVTVSDSIRVTFSMDLDSRYVHHHVSLMDSEGHLIDGRTNYRKKVLTFIPLKPLDKGKNYIFSLVGDIDLEDNKVEGIRGLTGETMAGRYSIHFSTELGEVLPPPKVVSPAHGTVVRKSPVLAWEPVSDSIGYEIQLSQTNTFNIRLFPIDDEETVINETSVEPNVELEDGIYYWRIRSVRSDGHRGLWSRIHQFHLSTVIEGKISEEDPEEMDPAGWDEEDFELELVEVFPKEDLIQVPTNVQTLYFRVIGQVNPSLLDSRSVTLTGVHLSEDEEEESHGEVQGTATIVESDDGTTYIVFTPQALEEEAGES